MSLCVLVVASECVCVCAMIAFYRTVAVFLKTNIKCIQRHWHRHLADRWRVVPTAGAVLHLTLSYLACVCVCECDGVLHVEIMAPTSINFIPSLLCCFLKRSAKQCLTHKASAQANVFDFGAFFVYVCHHTFFALCRTNSKTTRDTSETKAK